MTPGAKMLACCAASGPTSVALHAAMRNEDRMRVGYVRRIPRQGEWTRHTGVSSQSLARLLFSDGHPHADRIAVRRIVVVSPWRCRGASARSHGVSLAVVERVE